jgi:hypothetical protein
MLECCCFFNIRHVLYILELLNMLELLLLNFCTCYMSSEFAFDACCYFFNIRPSMVSKNHSELANKQTWDRYERFTSPLSRTAPPSHQEVGSSSRCCTTPPPSRQEVRSSSRRRTAPPPSRQEEASSDDSIVEMWKVSPPPTRLEEASSDDSPSASSGYNDECPHIKEVSSYELLLDFNCLV